MAAAARQAARDLPKSTRWAPPAELAPRPAWLQLGARVRLDTGSKTAETLLEQPQPVSETGALDTAIAGELYIVSIRPIAGGWEILSHRSANRWIAAGAVEFLDSPPQNYAAWPGGSPS